MATDTGVGAGAAHEAEDEDLVPYQAGSTLDRLARRRRALANRHEETFWIEVPFEGLLGMRVQLLEWGTVTRYAEGVAESRNPEASANASGQLIWDACLAVVMRDGYDDPKGYSPDPQRESVPKPDHGLLRVFAEKERQIVLAEGGDPASVADPPASAKPYHLVRLLFANDGAVDKFAGELIRWMRGEHSSVNGDFAEG